MKEERLGKWRKAIIKGDERSTDGDEWNRLQPEGVGAWCEGQVELHHSLWFLPPGASSRS